MNLRLSYQSQIVLLIFIFKFESLGENEILLHNIVCIYIYGMMECWNDYVMVNTKFYC